MRMNIRSISPTLPHLAALNVTARNQFPADKSKTDNSCPHIQVARFCFNPSSFPLSPSYLFIQFKEGNFPKPYEVHREGKFILGNVEDK